MPAKLLASMIMDMASNKKLGSWNVASAEERITFRKLFPFCNDTAQDPTTDVENVESVRMRLYEKEDRMSREDHSLCIRALKVVKQMAVSRSRFSVGPLISTLSIAGIMKCTPFQRSLLHSLGIATSLDNSALLTNVS